MQHTHHETRLRILGQLLRMTYQLLHVISPWAIILSMTELSQNLLGSLCLAHEYRTTYQVLQGLYVPAMLHAILHTQTVAVVEQSVLVVDHTSEDLVQRIDRHRRITLRLALGEVVHLVELTA